MWWYTRFAVGLAVCLACVPGVSGQEPSAESKANVELRWVESERIEGLTEDEGIRTSCDPMDIMYAHKMPALVLTADEVAEARLTKHDLRSNGLGDLYSVTFHLTNKAREKLAVSCDTLEQRGLALFVDGKYGGGVHRYEKDKTKPFIPDQCRAETFTPSFGFFSSREKAERIVEACR